LVRSKSICFFLLKGEYEMKGKFSIALSLTLIVALVFTAVAFADQVVNNIDTTIDSALETRTITSGESTAVGFYIKSITGGGDANGCNATGSDEAYFTVTPPDGVTVSWDGYPDPIEFVGCDNYRYVTFSSSTPGSYAINGFTMTGGKTNSQWDFSTADFTLVVNPAAPTNTAPTVVVTGVTDGASYEFGSVPDAVCEVTDTEDGNSTFPATLSAITGPLATYGLGSQTASCAYTDAGDLSASASATYTIVDTTAPVVTVTPVRGPDQNGWYNAPVDFDTTGTDGASGVASCTGLQTYSAPDGTGLTVSGSCTDNAGNVGNGTSDPFNFDDTDPSVSVALDRLPFGTWFNLTIGAPIAQFTCSDGTSDIASCPADYTFPEGADLSHDGTAYDNAGNSAMASIGSVYVDLTAPTLTWDPAMIADGASFYFGFVPAYPPNPCVAADALSGSDGCEIVDSNPGGFGALGSHTLTATAYDVAGNSYSETRSYEVEGWTLSGFFKPVDKGVLNVAKNGSTVPLKFTVFAGGTELTDVTFIKDTFIQTLTCGVGTPTDDIETYATGGTSLRYSDGQFIFNWQTPKKAGNCYRVTLTTMDGSSIYADFKLK
jgi:hypothetical protein